MTSGWETKWVYPGSDGAQILLKENTTKWTNFCRAFFSWPMFTRSSSWVNSCCSGHWMPFVSLSSETSSCSNISWNGDL